MSRTMTTQLNEDSHSASGRRLEAPASSWRWWWAGAVAAVLTLVVTNIVVSWDARAPRTPWDEIGILQMARLLSGDGSVSPMLGAGYYPGASFFLAPIWWLSDDPYTVYRLGTGVAITVGLLTVLPLTLLGRRLGLATPQAVTVAAIALCLPARTVHADYVLSENFFTWWLVWSVVAAHALWDRPRTRYALMFALAVSLTYLTHARGAALVLVAFVWLMLMLRSRTRAAMTAIVALAIGTAVVDAVTGRIHDRMLVSGFGQDDLLMEAISSTTPGWVARVFLNQAWAQIVGTAGLFALGLLVLAVYVVRELRHRVVGPAGFIAGTVSAFALLSVLWWSGPKYLLSESPRFDVWVYTRYIDPVAVIVVVVALAALMHGLRGGVIGATVVVALFVIVPVVFWVAPHVPTWGAYRGPGNAAAVLQWRHLWPTEHPFERPLIPSLTNANRFWLLASIFALCSLVVVALLRRRPRFLALVAIVVAVMMSLFANPDQKRDPPLALAGGVEQAEAAAEGQTLPVEVDIECDATSAARTMTLNWVGFWMPRREVRPVVPSRDGFESPLVIACDTWELAYKLGAQAVRDASNYGFRVWVLPGPVQDELARRGQLGIPAGIEALTRP